MNKKTILSTFGANTLCWIFFLGATNVALANDSETEKTALSSNDENAKKADNVAEADQQPNEVIEVIEHLPPGSIHTVTKTDLERFEHDDIHKILSGVPGVYIREEDGYGLRPNIGMRGSGSERSAKISLMEDGVLIAPAPYSAPAAYYFPLMTRMSSVEVLKGPSSVRFGPNTVGGAVDLITKSIPHQREFLLDLAGGEDVYGKAHLSYGDSYTYGGWLIEGVKLRTDGFKDLDGGGTTGFDKNDVMLKLRLNSNPMATVYHQAELKLGFATETSQETYTGLSDKDFRETPLRRYVATQKDQMDWSHLQLQVNHKLRLSETTSINTVIYRNTFSRDWRKLSGFNTNRTLTSILANPTSGNNAVFYSILTGQSDSSSTEETLIVGTNARNFVSQGIQTVAKTKRYWFNWQHDLELGVRYHFDSAERQRFEKGYFMTDGQMEQTTVPEDQTLHSVGSAHALASHFQHRVKINNIRITGGVRGEFVTTRAEDLMGLGQSDNASFVAIPGGGVTYQATPSLGLLAGVHRGFVPVAPGQGENIEPEKSLNYEMGFRFSSPSLRAEVIGFFSDYSNLKGTCTFSSGCMDGQVGEEFNGGGVHVMGIETQLATSFSATNSLHIPVNFSYTLNHSSFKTDFSSTNPQWGSVEVNDEIPYLPSHQLALYIGAKTEKWELNIVGRYISAMRDSAGQGEVVAAKSTDSTTVFDIAGNYKVSNWAKLYFSANNILNSQHIVSRRPYGARPGMPRFVVIGVKNQF